MGTRRTWILAGLMKSDVDELVVDSSGVALAMTAAA
jgi:hypothetical protein